jgi:multidrug efflux pump subunit AcrA (membrane-fusion protein)
MARADIYPEGTIRALMIPLEAALDASDNAAFVYTYARGEISRKRIRTGPVSDSFIIVNEGLSEGDTIVTAGATYLEKDARVTIVE